jgi:hypothetical protein
MRRRRPNPPSPMEILLRKKTGAAKDKCNARCHARDAGYFCFFDCRLEYIACLAGTLFKAGGSGIILQ